MCSDRMNIKPALRLVLLCSACQGAGSSNQELRHLVSSSEVDVFFLETKFRGGDVWLQELRIHPRSPSYIREVTLTVFSDANRNGLFEAPEQVYATHSAPQELTLGDITFSNLTFPRLPNLRAELLVKASRGDPLRWSWSLYQE